VRIKVLICIAPCYGFRCLCSAHLSSFSQFATLSLIFTGVVVGSMGGTDRDNFLNTIGDGDILVWKRRAEAYLLKSGLNYTIIHPGGLKDDEGGKRELVFDVDDNLISTKSKYRSIPRGDVAELCVQSLHVGGKAFDCRAVDVVAKDVGDGAPTTDFVGLLEKMDKNCSYKDMEGDEVLAKV
jgi:NAD(P)H-binding